MFSNLNFERKNPKSRSLSFIFNLFVFTLILIYLLNVLFFYECYFPKKSDKIQVKLDQNDILNVPEFNNNNNKTFSNSSSIIIENFTTSSPQNDTFFSSSNDIDLLIAIPTVYRPIYLSKTIDSLLFTLSQNPKIKILISLSSLNKTQRDSMKSFLFKQYINETKYAKQIIIVETNHILAGILLKNPCSMKHTYGDSPGRVVWRSTMALSHSWLVYRAALLQPRYLFLIEDDTPLSNDTYDLWDMIWKSDSCPSKLPLDWQMVHYGINSIHVSPVKGPFGGSFGILFKNQDINGTSILDILSSFILRYFDTSPIDWLYSLFYHTLESGYDCPGNWLNHIGTISTKSFSDLNSDKQWRNLCGKEAKIIKDCGFYCSTCNFSDPVIFD